MKRKWETILVQFERNLEIFGKISFSVFRYNRIEIIICVNLLLIVRHLHIIYFNFQKGFNWRVMTNRHPVQRNEGATNLKQELYNRADALVPEWLKLFFCADIVHIFINHDLLCHRLKWSLLAKTYCQQQLPTKCLIPL